MKHCRPCLVVALTILGLSLSTCGLAKSWPEQKGKVLEAGSRAPITGAIIVARWKGTRSILVDSQTDCYHVETATTNERGEYVIPAWNEGVKASMIYGDKYVSVTSYKAGYVRSQEYYKTQSQKQNIDLLERFKGTAGERLEYLMHLSGLASCYGTDEKPLFPMQKALYQEARGLAVAPQGQDSVQWIRHRAALVWKKSEAALTDGEIETLIRSDNFLSEQLK